MNRAEKRAAREDLRRREEIYSAIRTAAAVGEYELAAQIAERHVDLVDRICPVCVVYQFMPFRKPLVRFVAAGPWHWVCASCFELRAYIPRATERDEFFIDADHWNVPF